MAKSEPKPNKTPKSSIFCLNFGQKELWHNHVNHSKQWEFVYYFGNSRDPVWGISKKVFWSSRSRQSIINLVKKSPCPDSHFLRSHFSTPPWPKNSFFILPKQGLVNCHTDLWIPKYTNKLHQKYYLKQDLAKLWPACNQISNLVLFFGHIGRKMNSSRNPNDGDEQSKHTKHWKEAEHPVSRRSQKWSQKWLVNHIMVQVKMLHNETWTPTCAGLWGASGLADLANCPRKTDFHLQNHESPGRFEKAQRKK